jgi:hypothetical protein
MFFRFGLKLKEMKTIGKTVLVVGEPSNTHDYEKIIISLIKSFYYQKKTESVLGGFYYTYTNIQKDSKVKIKVTLSTCQMYEPTLEINDEKINNFHIQYIFFKQYFYKLNL